MANSSDASNGNSLDFDTTPSWRILRIMSEFVSGFAFLGNIQKSVTIFGSARLPEDHPLLQESV